VARLLLTFSLLAAALGALATAGAPGPAVAATGDRWVWPGPPSAEGGDAPGIYDQRRDRLTFFLEDRRGYVTPWTVPCDSTWMWTPWPVRVVGSSNALGTLRSDPYAYDPTGDRLLGLEDVFVPDDTCCGGQSLLLPWQMTLGDTPTVHRIPTRGAILPFRGVAAVAYDSRRSRLLIYGGEGDGGNASGIWNELDAYALAPDSATGAVIPTGPAAPYLAHAFAVYDSLTDRLWLFGGRDSLHNQNRETYTYDVGGGGGWTRLPIAASLDDPSLDTTRQRIQFDPMQRRLILAYESYGQFDVKGAVWRLDLDDPVAWLPVANDSGAPLALNGRQALDPAHDRLYVLGQTSPQSFLYALALDSPAGWSAVAAGGTQFDFGGDDVAFVDPRSGGEFGFDFNEPRISYLLRPGPNVTWTTHVTQGICPAGRNFPAAAYDPVRRRGVLFGGRAGSLAGGDLWQWTINDTGAVSWRQLFLDGEAPSPRWGASMIFDPVRSRMVLFGGWEGRTTADTWELVLDPVPAWHRLSDRGFVPPPRWGAAVAYDSRRDVMFVMGGWGGPAGGTLLNDTWALSFADGQTWLPVTTLGTPPSPRAEHRMIYDSRRDRLLVLWGMAYGGGGRPDVAELDLAEGPTWQTGDAAGVVPSLRADFGAVYDPVLDEAIIVGGNQPNRSLGPYQFALLGDFSANPITSPPVLHGPPLLVYGLAPNPTRDVLNIVFELPVDTGVEARIYNAAGRLVRDLGRRPYVAGRHLLLWDGKTDGGAVPASGVYFARLSILGHDFNGKFVYLR